MEKGLEQEIGDSGVIPVIRMEDATQAPRLAEALLAGGLPCAEVTFRTAEAEATLRCLARHPEILLGAGTILSVEQARRAIDAGARFLVSPGFNPKVVQHCLSHGHPIIPGVSNPSDIEMALDHGVTLVKFFPAEAYGGLKTLRALSSPYGMMRFVPTGGISTRNLAAYLAFTPVVACGGSWMVEPSILSRGDFSTVRTLCQEAVEAVRLARTTACA